MAHLKSRTLFFTTSPRTPIKMIPEIRILCDNFSGQPWNTHSQTAFFDVLVEDENFEGQGAQKDKAFSARDRITRAPKALGFVDLHPTIEITDAGKNFIDERRTEEALLRQLLKFQLPSPYHSEPES